MFFKIDVLKNFTNFTEKCLYWGINLVKLQAWYAATLLKKRLQHRCFPVKFAEFLRTSFFYRTPLVAAFLRLSGLLMLCGFNWYVEILAQVFSCEFFEIFKNITDHLRWLLLSVIRCTTSKYTVTATCNGLIVWW